MLRVSEGSGGKEGLKNVLFEFLADSTPVEPSSKERGGGALSTPLEQLVFVRGSYYGTRASSVIIVDQHGHAAFFERTFHSDGQLVLESEERLEFNK